MRRYRKYRDIRFANDPDWERAMKNLSDAYKETAKVGKILQDARLSIARLANVDLFATREASRELQDAENNYIKLSSSIARVARTVKDIQ
ncbi:MAG: hypothetical protein IJG38_02440 [Thermoguttaceae bacterium]|nr:hypothetical protein [Thermoguttaceae bacterium]